MTRATIGVMVALQDRPGPASAPAGRLLERAPYLAHLHALLDDARAGQGRLVFLGGEAGVGKTALMQQFCAEAAPDALVFVGACDPLSTPRPLGPVVDIADAIDGEIAALLDESDRGAVFRALLAALHRCTRPIVVLFEDVHWADAATLDLLRFFGRRIATTSTLLIATYRDDEVGPHHPLRVVLGDLATAASVRRMSLPPLSEAAVHVMAADTPLDPDALYRQTGGNPFYVTEVLACGEHCIPPTVRDAVLARAARLSPAGRETLEAAAVIGARIEPWLLAAVAGPGTEPVDECLAIGMIAVRGEHFVFRHELAREAALAGLSPHRSAMLHARVLAALRAAGEQVSDMARLAHHAEAAGDREAVPPYAVAAAERAASLGAHREAAAQYARALRYGDDLPAAERAALLEARAYACYLTEQPEEAIADRHAALAIWREAGDALKIGENPRWLSRLSWFVGRSSDAERFACEALAILETMPPGPQLAMAYSNLSQLRMLADDRDEAIRWGTQAIALAETLGDQETLVHALNNVGTASDNEEEERAYLGRSLALARAAGFEDHVVRAYANLVSNAVRRYDLTSADAYLAEGLACCADRDLESWQRYLEGWRAAMLFLRGQWDEAAAVATALLHQPNLSVISRIVPLSVLGRIRARRGDPEVADVLDEALALASGTGEVQRIGLVRAARAEAAWLAGDAERTRAEARAGLAVALAHQDQMFTDELAYWLWRGGEERSALPPLGTTPFALQIAGRWEEASEAWRRLGIPYQSAWARAESGDECVLRCSLAEFERLGARATALCVARELRTRGVRGIPRGPRPTTRATPALLTRREHEILRLLAEGLRNGEIADRLSLSPKTVEHHVSAVLAKLETRSRIEAVREAERLGLLAENGESPAPN